MRRARYKPTSPRGAAVAPGRGRPIGGYFGPVRPPQGGGGGGGSGGVPDSSQPEERVRETTREVVGTARIGEGTSAHTAGTATQPPGSGNQLTSEETEPGILGERLRSTAGGREAEENPDHQEGKRRATAEGMGSKADIKVGRQKERGSPNIRDDQRRTGSLGDQECLGKGARNKREANSGDSEELSPSPNTPPLKKAFVGKTPPEHQRKHHPQQLGTEASDGESSEGMEWIKQKRKGHKSPKSKKVSLQDIWSHMQSAIKKRNGALF